MKPPHVLVFLCLLVALVTGNLVQFGVMIEKMTGKSALQYNDYGCYCGVGGSHWPVDETDWCCHAHDCCYGRLEKLGCEPKLEKYLFSVSKRGIFCGCVPDPPRPAEAVLGLLPVPRGPASGCCSPSPGEHWHQRPSLWKIPFLQTHSCLRAQRYVLDHH
ncbi:group IIE secretory phospholipase A2 isoform X1 [Trachypithecus francoisi]|nr:group IIE secretory phospholipase A2 isoform X1 [Trachypithecus francoisi]